MVSNSSLRKLQVRNSVFPSTALHCIKSYHQKLSSTLSHPLLRLTSDLCCALLRVVILNITFLITVIYLKTTQNGSYKYLEARASHELTVSISPSVRF